MWLWVARPKYTQEGSDHGPDRDILGPGYVSERGGWWSCDESTCDGDLALLYRTSPYSEVRWLMKTLGDPYSIEDEPTAQREGWTCGSDYEVLARFETTITFAEMANSQPLNRWDAIDRNLHGAHGAWPIPMVYWRALATRILSRNPGARSAFADHMQPTPEWLRR